MTENCTCKFVGRGVPMKKDGCAIHTKAAYPCDDCDCSDYKPIRDKRELQAGGFSWSRCICGHIAQAHN